MKWCYVTADKINNNPTINIQIQVKLKIKLTEAATPPRTAQFLLCLPAVLYLV